MTLSADCRARFIADPIAREAIMKSVLWCAAALAAGLSGCMAADTSELDGTALQGSDEQALGEGTDSSASSPFVLEANRFDCACIHNLLGFDLPYLYQWEGQSSATTTVPANTVHRFCVAHSAAPPGLTISYDSDLRPGGYYVQNYSVPLAVSAVDECRYVPESGHYHFTYEAGTDNKFIQLYRGSGG
jgi:hypothetical protein